MITRAERDPPPARPASAPRDVRPARQRAEAAGCAGDSPIASCVVAVDVVEALGLGRASRKGSPADAGVAAAIDRDDRHAVGDVVLQDLDPERSRRRRQQRRTDVADGPAPSTPTGRHRRQLKQVWKPGSNVPSENTCSSPAAVAQHLVAEHVRDDGRVDARPVDDHRLLSARSPVRLSGFRRGRRRQVDVDWRRGQVLRRSGRCWRRTKIVWENDWMLGKRAGRVRRVEDGPPVHAAVERGRRTRVRAEHARVVSMVARPSFRKACIVGPEAACTERRAG